MTKKHPPNRARTKKNNRTALIVVTLVVVLLAVFFSIMFNYWSEMGLLDQFAKGFFDFSQFAVSDDDPTDLEGVIAKYEPVFDKLQVTAIDRLEELYLAAAAEYRAEKEAGTLNRFRLTNKYLQAGRRLEKSVDKAFYTLLEGMERELIRKNLPNAIVAEIDEEYKNRKKEKKEELFGRLRNRVDF